MEEFVKKWDNGLAFTLETIDAMPDDLLDYKPHASAMSFKEQVAHSATSIVWIAKNTLDGPEPDFDTSATPANKAELKALVEASYAYGKNLVASLSPEDLETQVESFAGTVTKRQLLALMDDHATHHRGAAIAYIRANGIEPPRYRGL
ncbi:DinB family protein [Nitritalea halalkaliphila LW7]|uniref:DinB family protein n=1 Tax=Nitritalea halalkaliphila LW7 TaxID=1189621 RepID=I5C9C4_9BACT|nr:DinB family protein [Nitritalea halalkaliphila]EIM78426.1 DinB family protein [Nitritalea halalkaliphila LW7]